MTALKIGRFPVELHLCSDGFWKHDSVFIYAKCISGKEIANIMDYLYEEAFIQDRRTKFFIARDEN